LNVKIKHSQTEMGLVFFSIMGLVFLVVRHLSHDYSTYFSAYFIHASMDPFVLLNFLPYCLSVCGKPHHLALIVYSFQGIKQKYN